MDPEAARRERTAGKLSRLKQFKGLTPAEILEKVRASAAKAAPRAAESLEVVLTVPALPADRMGRMPDVVPRRYQLLMSRTETQVFCDVCQEWLVHEVAIAGDPARLETLRDLAMEQVVMRRIMSGKRSDSQLVEYGRCVARMERLRKSLVDTRGSDAGERGRAKSPEREADRASDVPADADEMFPVAKP